MGRSTYYGARLEALYRFAKQKGYEPICCDGNDNSAFFVEPMRYDRFGLENNALQLLHRRAMHKVRFIGRDMFVTGYPYRYGPGKEL